MSVRPSVHTSSNGKTNTKKECVMMRLLSWGFYVYFDSFFLVYFSAKFANFCGYFRLFLFSVNFGFTFINNISKRVL